MLSSQDLLQDENDELVRNIRTATEGTRQMRSELKVSSFFASISLSFSLHLTITQKHLQPLVSYSRKLSTEIGDLDKKYTQMLERRIVSVFVL